MMRLVKGLAEAKTLHVIRNNVCIIPQERDENPRENKCRFILAGIKNNFCLYCVLQVSLLLNKIQATFCLTECTLIPSNVRL